MTAGRNLHGVLLFCSIMAAFTHRTTYQRTPPHSCQIAPTMVLTSPSLPECASTSVCVSVCLCVPICAHVYMQVMRDGCRRGGSGGTAAAAGSSPGGLFPAGSSPHTTRKVYTPSPQQNSKWYIKVSLHTPSPSACSAVSFHLALAWFAFASEQLESCNFCGTTARL